MRKATIVRLFAGSVIAMTAAIVLLGGLVSLGFLATLAYVIAEPDGEQPVTGAPEQPLVPGTAVPATGNDRAAQPGPRPSRLTTTGP